MPATPEQLRQSSEAWDGFVADSTAGSHLQLTPWAEVKRPNGWRAYRVVADAGQGPIGAQVLVRRLGPGPFGVGYAPRGPLAASWDAASLGAFSGELRRLGRRLRLSHITIDPGVEDHTLAARLLAAGWRQADAVQHDRTRLIDVSQPEAALWSDLRATARRSVNRARRDGCTVDEGSAADLDAFFGIMVETSQRSGFIHRTRETYQGVLDAFASSQGASLLLARLADGSPAAAKLLVRCGGRVTQPYSGMTAAGAAARANFLLEWETIRRAAVAGERVYDMWGLAHPGIAYYKAGFGGREVTYPGTFDLPTLPLLREGLVRARRGYVWLARRRHGLSTRSDVADDQPVAEVEPS